MKLQGTISDITFYKLRGQFFAREKGGVEGSRIMTDPAFERTRENGAEFGRAGKAGKVLRNSIRPLLQRATDSLVSSRLTKRMTDVQKLDTSSVRGARNVLDGDLSILRGFEFNTGGRLSTTVYIPYGTQIDRMSGELTVTIPEFVPSQSIAAPSGATHLRFISGGSAVDFESEEFDYDSAIGTYIELGSQTEDEIILQSAVTEESTLPLFLLLGVEFFQEVNGTMYSLQNNAYNSLAITAIDLP